MKSFKKAFIILLTAIILCSCCSLNAFASGENVRFATGQVLVGLTDEGNAMLSSGLSLDLISRMLPEVKIIAVKDLTDVSDILEKKGIKVVDSGPRKSILQLTLAEDTEEAVLVAIDALKKNSYVKFAEVNLVTSISSNELPNPDTGNYELPSGYEGRFATGQVLVGLTDEGNAMLSSGLSLDLISRMLPEVKIIAVKDLTDVSDILEKKGIKVVEGKKRESILLITLTDNTEEAVLRACELLKKNPYIKYAEPDLSTSIFYNKQPELDTGSDEELPSDFENLDGCNEISSLTMSYDIELTPAYSSFVIGYSTNIPVSVTGSDADLPDLSLSLVKAPSMVYATALVVSGSATLSHLNLLDIDMPGIYFIQAMYNGIVVASVAVEYRYLHANVWAPSIEVAPNGQVAIKFYESIAAGSTLQVSLNGVVKNGIISVDNTVVIDYAYNSLVTGDNIMFKGVKYPELFPSYSFTFSLFF